MSSHNSNINLNLNLNSNLNSDLNLENFIEQAFDNINNISLKSGNQDLQNLKEILDIVIQKLANGSLRAAEKKNDIWIVNQWIKKAILLYFKLSDKKIIDAGFTKFYDKIPLKFADYQMQDWQQLTTRIVPPACIRQGAFIGENTVIMPSYINIGAFIDNNTMIDTWATIGTCAQIGKNVHISGGTGIGGVLEPIQANPTIIEDNCFIGARSEIVEGVIVETGAVISMGVFIGQSTRIYDRTKDEIIYGRVPAGSVVVPGTLPSSDNKCNLYAAIIVKKVDEKTKKKIGINQILRESILSTQ